jgi:hypothetical protein
MGRPGYPLRAMIGMVLAKSLHADPDMDSYGGCAAESRAVVDATPRRAQWAESTIPRGVST